MNQLTQTKKKPLGRRALIGRAGLVLHMVRDHVEPGCHPIYRDAQKAAWEILERLKNPKPIE